MKVIRGKKRNKSFLLRFALLAFSVYALVMVIHQQVVINEKKQELASVREQIRIQEIQNGDLKNAVSAGKDGGSGYSDYIEKAAREGLDFSKPNERVFVNIAGK
ncbi:MAG: septum formation initiator family protein [Oscillospiraceae bacterium]|jgi:cell division protein DivIC|nr:septum formation initiator family protein [Oscillospiraceae bacterium]